MGRSRDRKVRASRRALALASGFVAAWGSASPLAAQWVEAPGRGWASLALYHQDTRDVFDADSERGEFQGEGHAVTTSSYLTLALGIVEGVDVWSQLSFHRLRYDDVIGRRTSTGLGDVRLYARVSPLHFVGRRLPVAIRGGVKLPAGDFDTGSELIPLGDGQRDYEVMLELGHSFHPWPVYAMGWVGYRWRDDNDDPPRDFGDERFLYAALGGQAGPVGYKLAVDGWNGTPPTARGILATSGERDLAQVIATLLIAAGPGEVEIGARVPVSGRNLPAGASLVVGYFARFRL